MNRLMRNAFENWAEKERILTEKDEDGDYLPGSSNAAWRAWQAAWDYSNKHLEPGWQQEVQEGHDDWQKWEDKQRAKNLDKCGYCINPIRYPLGFGCTRNPLSSPITTKNEGKLFSVIHFFNINGRPCTKEEYEANAGATIEELFPTKT